MRWAAGVVWGLWGLVLLQLSAQCLSVSPVSYAPSTLYAGVNPQSAVQTVRLLRVDLFDSDSLHLYFVPLDRFGNADLRSDTVTVQIQMQALQSRIPSKLLFQAVAHRWCDRQPIDLVLCVEYTDATFPFFGSIAQALRSALPLLPPASTVSLVFYNHSINATQLQTPLEDYSSQFHFLGFAPRSNLSAFLRALYHTVAIPLASPDHRRVVIHIGRGVDNASLAVSLQDVFEAIRQQRVNLFFVGVGEWDNTALLSRFEAQVAAPLYFPSSISVSELKGIFQEIFLSLQTAYRVTVGYALYREWQQENRHFSIRCRMGAKMLSNPVRVEIDEARQTILSHQILATFATGSSRVDPVFAEQLDRVVELLRTNPEQRIVLQGHASASGTEQRNQQLSYARALAVKRYLVRKGIAADRIHCIGLSSTSPIYPLPYADWQRRLNRRVEIRWLTPALLPYEIYAERTVSEEQAYQLAEQWRSRGLNVYVKPIQRHRQTFFQVVLWGFESRDQAEAMRKLLQERYQVSTLEVVP